MPIFNANAQRCNTKKQKSYHLLLNPNAPAAVSNGKWAVKLCFNRILQFLTAGDG